MRTGKSSNAPQWAWVPLTIAKNPFFPPTAHPEGWIVRTVEDKIPVEYHIGTDADCGLATGNLTIDDASVLIALLRIANFRESRRVEFHSLSELIRLTFHRKANSRDKHTVVHRLGRLRSVGIVRRVRAHETAEIFTVLTDWNLSQYAPDGNWKRWDEKATIKEDYRYKITWVEFSEQFVRWMVDAIQVDQAAFAAIGNRLFRSLYLYLPGACFPTRVYTADNPRRMRLDRLLIRHGIQPPRYTSMTLQHFYRPEKGVDVVQALDGKPINGGRILRVRLEREKMELLVWIEQSAPPSKGTLSNVSTRGERSSLKDIWMDAGGELGAWKVLTAKSIPDSLIKTHLSLLVESGCMTPEQASNNKNLIRLLLCLIGDRKLHEIRSITAMRMKAPASDLNKRVTSPLGFFLGCAIEEIKSVAGVSS